MLKNLLLATSLVALAGTAHAATVTQAGTPADNDTTRAAWLTAIGEAEQYVLDFETGYADEDRVAGPTGVGGLTINGIAQGGGDPKIEQGAGAIGGSNPIGDFALELADDGPYSGQNDLVLSFDAPLAYLSFYILDAAQRTMHAGGESFSIASTAASGDSAEFVGVLFDIDDDVSRVAFDFTGSGAAGWAVDNITWGYAPMSPVPLPAGLPLLLAGLGAMGLIQRSRRSGGV